MPRGAEALVKIRALDKISKTLEKVRNKFPKMTRAVTRTSRAYSILKNKTSKLRNTLKKIGGTMQSIGRTMSVSLTLPILAFGTFAIKAAGDFEAAMKDVQGKTGATGKDLEALSKIAKKMGLETQFSSNQAADAQTFLAQAGLNTKQILTALPKTLELAAAANLDLAEAADISTNVLLGYGMQVSQLGKLNDVMTKASISSNLSVRELSESMKIAGPIFASQNTPLEETVAIMGNLANAGIKGSESGVALRKAMSSLLKPTKAAKETFAKLKIPANEILNADGSVKSFTNTIRLLEKRGATATDLINIFGQRAGPKLIPLLKQGTKAVDELATKLRGSTGTAAEIATLKMEGFNGMLKSLKSAFEGLGIAIADSGLLGFLTSMGKKLVELIRWIAGLNPSILKWGAVIAGVVAILGPLIFGLGTLITMAPFIITALTAGTAAMAGFAVSVWAATAPIIILAAKAALVVAALYGAFKAGQLLGEFLVDLFDGGVSKAIDNFASKVTGAFTRVKSFFSFGDDNDQEVSAEKTLNKKLNFSPKGAPTSSERTNQKAAQTNQNFIEKVNNANVNVKFTGAPAGTKITTESEGGFIDVSSNGLAGAF